MNRKKSFIFLGKEMFLLPIILIAIVIRNIANSGMISTTIGMILKPLVAMVILTTLAICGLVYVTIDDYC